MKPGRNLHLAFLFAVAILALVSCATNDVALHRYEFQQPQMGVPFRIVLYATDEAKAKAASDAAFKRISDLNAVLSDYDYDSELSRLSRTSGSGQKVPVSEDLWHVLDRAQYFSEQSRGAFDVTVGPAVNLWRKARREKKFPDETRLAAARKSVGYQYVKLNADGHTVELAQPNMRLDLGGIAKGYAVSEAMKVLKEHGIAQALVSGGGDLAVSDPPPGKKAWTVELPALDESGPSEFLYLKNKAMATSGDLFQFVELDGKRYSHIVDPRTGIGLVDHSRVVVVAQDGTTADALSTALSVLGNEAGLRVAIKHPQIAVRMSRQFNDKIQTVETSNFRQHLIKP